MASAPPNKKRKQEPAFLADYAEFSWKITETATGKTFRVDDLDEFQRKHDGFVQVGHGARLKSSGNYDEDRDGSYSIESFAWRMKLGRGEKEEESEEKGSWKNVDRNNLFGSLDEPLLADIFSFADLNDHFSIATTCKLFNQVAGSTLLISQLVARVTRPARAAKAKRQEVAKKAEEHMPRRKTLEYDVGTYQGKVWRGQAHGLGTYKAHKGKETYRGHWKDGAEHGVGSAVCDDGSRYDGDFVAGQRHGFGVQIFQDGYDQLCRYEGGWEHDKRHGVGLLLGAAYRFCVGRYKNGEPIGLHAAFNYDDKRVVYLQF